jgi:hypothetical protein
VGGLAQGLGIANSGKCLVPLGEPRADFALTCRGPGVSRLDRVSMTLLPLNTSPHINDAPSDERAAQNPYSMRNLSMRRVVSQFEL